MHTRSHAWMKIKVGMPPSLLSRRTQAPSFLLEVTQLLGSLDMDLWNLRTGQFPSLGTWPQMNVEPSPWGPSGTMTKSCVIITSPVLAL